MGGSRGLPCDHPRPGRESGRAPRRPTIVPRPRITSVLLSLAVLAGAAGTVPAAAEVAVPTLTSTVASDATEGLHLDRAEAQRVRDHVARTIRQHPAEFAALGRTGTQAGVVAPDVVRHTGKDRYAVAAALADAYWVKYFWNPEHGPITFAKTVFIASGADFPDALSGGAAAAAWGGPLLLTKKDEVPGATRDALQRLQPDVIVVLGGTATVSAAVEGQLQEYVRTPQQVTRVGGKDRFHVSANLASHIGWSDTAYVASGRNFPDGLSGGAAAGFGISPLLITDTTSVPGVVMEVLRTEVLPERIIVLGGPRSVSEDVLTQLRTTGAKVERVSGADRYEVAANAAALHPSLGLATISSGQAWADALAGSALAGLVGSKLLLVRPDGVPGPTAGAIERRGLGIIDVLGGTTSVHESVLGDLSKLRVPE